MRAMGYSVAEACGHGFRATAASALAEMGFRREVIDCQLSHRERSAVLGAYVHLAEYLDERRHMMQHWGDHLDKLEHGGESIPLKGKPLEDIKADSPPDRGHRPGSVWHFRQQCGGATGPSCQAA